MSAELEKAKARLAVHHVLDRDEFHCPEGCCGVCRCGEPYPCDARIFAEALDPTVKENLA